MNRSPKMSQSYSLSRSTIRLIAAQARREGKNPSQVAEEALRFWALSHGPVAQDQADAEREALLNEQEDQLADDAARHQPGAAA
ncbi:MAG: hypothetical protein IRZ07_05750 [Microbispora sp.]|nr:hypothetical protein [Microbispora sp.]